MIQGIDHIVILVNDLSAAVEDYRGLGFTVTAGGEHAGGLTHNALVSFQDGSYLELIAFKGAPPTDHFFYREGGQEGLITYALLPGDTVADVEAARARGLGIEGPMPGGRLRPDGVEVSWQIAVPPTRDLPFLCGDVTPRERRVAAGEARIHENGVSGIAAITVLVRDLEESAQRYSALLGKPPDTPRATAPNLDGYMAVFIVGGSEIILLEPVDGPEVYHLHDRGEGVYRVALRPLAGESTGEALDIARAHGAVLTL